VLVIAMPPEALRTGDQPRAHGGSSPIADDAHLNDPNGKPLVLSCDALRDLHRRELDRAAHDLAKELFEDHSAADRAAVANSLMRSLHLAVIGRLADKCRFQLTAADLAAPVTAESLKRQLMVVEEIDCRFTNGRSPEPVQTAAAVVASVEASPSPFVSADTLRRANATALGGASVSSDVLPLDAIRMSERAPDGMAGAAARVPTFSASSAQRAKVPGGVKSLEGPPSFSDEAACNASAEDAAVRDQVNHLRIEMERHIHQGTIDTSERRPWMEAFERVWHSYEQSASRLAAASPSGPRSAPSPLVPSTTLRRRRPRGRAAPVASPIDIRDFDDAADGRSDGLAKSTTERMAFHRNDDNFDRIKQFRRISVRSAADAGNESDDSLSTSDSPSSIKSPTFAGDAPRPVRQAAAWATVHGVETNTSPPSWRQLLHMQFASFPETSPEQRATLLHLSHRPVVSRHDVMRALSIRKDHELLRFLFATGAEVLSGDVFRDVAASLGERPRPVSFAPHFTSHLIGVSRRLTTFLPNLIVLVIIFTIAPMIADVAQLMMTRTVQEMIDDEWPTGCNVTDALLSGPLTSTLGCALRPQTLTTSKYVEMDVIRFFSRTALELLWGDAVPAGVPASHIPHYGAWLLGGVLIRQSPVVPTSSLARSFDPVDRAVLVPCEANNISTQAVQLDAGASFTCESYWSVVIPFGLVFQEAHELAARYVQVLNFNETHGTSALHLEYAAYARESGLLLHTRVSVALPDGGGVMPRYDVTTIDARVAVLVIPLLVAELLSTVVIVVRATHSWLLNRGLADYRFDLVRSALSSAMLCVSFAHLQLSADFVSAAVEGGGVDVTFQDTFVVPGIDRAAEQFNVGMSLLGFYVLFFVGSLMRFLRDMPGLELVVQILRRSAYELVCLVAIFAAWTAGFVFVSMALFGSTLASFASAASATLTLLSYFMNRDNFSELAEHSPILGPCFWFLYQLFVVFFALNLLIAVMTAPLAEIRADMKLDRDMLDLIGRRLSASTTRGFGRFTQWFMYSHFFLPIVSVVYDCRPASRPHWTIVNECLRTLYSERDASVFKVVSAADRLIALIGNADVHRTLADEWSTPLLRHTVQSDLIRGRSSLAVIVSAIASESRFTFVRDARLLAAVYQHNRFHAKLDYVQRHQHNLKGLVREQTGRMTRKLALAEQAAARLVNSLSHLELTQLVHGERQVVLSESALTADESAGDVVFPSEVALASHFALSAERRSLSSVVICREGTSVDSEHPSKPVVSNPAGALSAPGHAAVMIPTDARAIIAASIAADDTQVENALADLTPTLADLCRHYNFGKHLISQLRAHGTGTAVYTLIVLGLVSWLCVPFVTEVNNTAYLSRSVLQGLRDMPFPTRCSDENCTTGLTYSFTFNDIATIAEYKDWLAQVVLQQLFSPLRPPVAVGAAAPATRARLHAAGIEEWLGATPANYAAAFNTTGEGVGWPTLWDSRILRLSAVTVRQLRAMPTACQDVAVTRDESAAARMGLRYKRHQPLCFAAGGSFDKSDMHNINASALSDAALRFTPTCVHRQPDPYFGVHTLYPCGGYVATFATGDALIEGVVRSNWIDAQTRFVVTSAEFTSGGSRITASFYLEVHQGGGSVVTHAMAVAIGSSATLNALAPHRVVYVIALVLRLTWFLLELLGYVYKACVRHRDAVRSTAVAPRVPLFTFAAFAMFFMLGYLAFDDDDETGASFQSALMVAHAVVEITTSVVFPLGALNSKPVKTLVDALGISARNCLYVLPLLAVFYAAFIPSGVLLFGRTATDFANERVALRSIISGTFGRWDVESLQIQRPIEAQIFTLAFYACVLVVLANMFLAVVTNASSEASATPPSVELAESVLYYFGRKPMYGAFLPVFLNASLGIAQIASNPKRWLHCLIPGHLKAYRRPVEPAVITPAGRIWFPSECLVPRIRPLRCSMVLKLTHHDELNPWAYGAMVPYLLESYLGFRSNHHVLHAHDSQRNDAECIRFAEAYALEVVPLLAQKRLLGHPLKAYTVMRPKRHGRKKPPPSERQDAESGETFSGFSRQSFGAGSNGDYDDVLATAARVAAQTETGMNFPLDFQASRVVNPAPMPSRRRDSCSPAASDDAAARGSERHSRHPRRRGRRMGATSDADVAERPRNHACEL
jgi:hypothetical protein